MNSGNTNDSKTKLQEYSLKNLKLPKYTFFKKLLHNTNLYSKQVEITGSKK